MEAYTIKNEIEKLRSLYEKQSFIGDSVKIASWAKTFGYNIVYKGYNVVSSVKAIKFSTAIARFIQADVRGMAGIAAPGFKVFGRTAGAKVLSGVFSVVGIAAGVWDIVDGAGLWTSITAQSTQRRIAKQQTNWIGRVTIMKNC